MLEWCWPLCTASPPQTPCWKRMQLRSRSDDGGKTPCHLGLEPIWTTQPGLQSQRLQPIAARVRSLSKTQGKTGGFLKTDLWDHCDCNQICKRRCSRRQNKGSTIQKNENWTVKWKQQEQPSTPNLGYWMTSGGECRKHVCMRNVYWTIGDLQGNGLEMVSTESIMAIYDHSH